jgi:hypothetical protein
LLKMQGGTLDMRIIFVIFAIAITVCSCSGRFGQAPLEPLARGISEAVRPAYADFTLEIRAIDNGGRVTLHCVLKNVSIATTAIVVDASTLPWRNPEGFDINAVAANGDVVHRDPPPVEVAQIRGMPTPLTIASGNSIEGEMELGKMPIGSLPRHKDLLLLWSTSIRSIPSDHATELRGATFLRAISLVADRRSSPSALKQRETVINSSISGTSAPTTAPKSVDGDERDKKPPSPDELHDAPERIFIGNAVVRIEAFPWENHQPRVGIRDPDSRKMRISFRLVSETATPLPPMGQVRTLSIFQDGKVWQTSAIEETVGAADRSSREFMVHDGPIGQSRSPIDIVVELGNDGDTRYLLALRHQQINAVE